MATYSQHQKIVAKRYAAYNDAYRAMGESAIRHGHGMVKTNELRTMPEYEPFFRVIDILRDIWEAAQRAAIADHCAYCDQTSGYRFEWYSERDARRWRMQAKRRAA